MAFLSKLTPPPPKQPTSKKRKENTSTTLLDGYSTVTTTTTTTPFQVTSSTTLTPLPTQPSTVNNLNNPLTRRSTTTTSLQTPPSQHSSPALAHTDTSRKRKTVPPDPAETPQLLTTLEQVLDLTGREWLRQTRVRVEGMKKKEALELGLQAKERLKTATDNFKRKLEVIVDLTDYKTGVTKTLKKEKKKRGQVWGLEFVNPGLNQLVLERILKKPKVSNCIPTFFEEKEVEVSYTYVPTIRKKILNYKKVLEETAHLSLEEIPCLCKGHVFTHGKLGHVCTGDLEIIGNSPLKRLLERGPKYRERKATDWKEVQEEVVSSLDRLVSQWSKKEEVVEDALQAWKDEVKRKVVKEIDRLSKTIPPDPGNSILTTDEGKKALAAVHKSYVLVSADKSENNTIVVCKRYYVERLRQELAAEGTDKSTYKRQTESAEEVIKKQVAKVGDLGFEVEEAHRALPTLYWLPKMHYDPPRCRFIAASDRCVTKGLSQCLSKCLKVIQSEHKLMGFEEKDKFHKFWIVGSTEEVLAKVERVNARNTAHTIDSFDFSTLYTNLEHTVLKKNLRWVVEEAFKRKSGFKLAVYEKEAKWVKNPRQETKVVSQARLLWMLSYLIDNAMINYGGVVYKQCIGIPMGTDCGPFLANLGLYASEYRWVQEKEKTELGRELLRELGINCRYIDDLLSLNGGSLIERFKTEIYPGLHLKKENEHNYKTHFLDLDLQIHVRQIRRKTYDKRDAFGFEVRSFPDLTGNLHKVRAHGVVLGQLRRYAQTCQNYSDFKHRVQTLTTRLQTQAFDRLLLEKRIRLFFQENEVVVSKYGKVLEECVKDSFAAEEANEKEVETRKRKRSRRAKWKSKKRAATEEANQ